MQKDQAKRQEQVAPTELPRAEYEAPVLKEFGNVAEAKAYEGNMVTVVAAEACL